MTRAREAVAADFLRKALAAKPVGVPQLDMMARTAGLLGEGPSITQAKVFRQAKKSIGIRSMRRIGSRGVPDGTKQGFSAGVFA
jgi:hypothetical protein